MKELLKQASVLLDDKSFEISEITIGDGKVYIYVEFNYDFVKEMTRRKYDVVDDNVPFSTLMWKNDNVIYTTYKHSFK
jgi:hypothetical protein